jgi:integrase
LSFVRGFARHHLATDPSTEVPPTGLLPYRPARARPYLYSHDEVGRLLEQALQLPAGVSDLRPWTYHALLGLLSVTGLRVGEALRLRFDDVDLDAGVLTVRGTKFGKSRLVPIHASTRDVLVNYMAVTYDVRSTTCRARSGCAGRKTATDHGCTTFAIDLPSRR